MLVVSLSVDATVHAHTRMWLERLLSGSGLPAWAALHSVSLSPPQPAMAGPVHGEWYNIYIYYNINVKALATCQFKYCTCKRFSCWYWALVCSSVCPGYQLRASIYSYGPADSQPSPFTLDASIRSAEALSGTQTLSFHFFLCTLWNQKEGILLVQVTSSALESLKQSHKSSSEHIFT